ncbi:helix-turn-helix transcriptional regulator [Paenibacillus graminis]|uniref:helix-turn-helix transcriptional regulator n=1 Tax=Paenibacillus graminis TaxID=189425 RepID=UPI002DB8EDE8|nr:helix-turn-helix transcriptional regulator [Paenibacillus graminis]MEC0171141.1 helix-turn-helix transcriptional regulator [Paenibacillus graminis]
MINGLELARSSLSKGRHMITLREARENTFMSVDHAARKAGITVTRLKAWEINCGNVDTYFLLKLLRVYNVSFSHVYAGKEADLLQARREASKMEKQTVDVADLIEVLKQEGINTSELERMVEEIRAKREAETKNRPNALTLASAR